MAVQIIAVLGAALLFLGLREVLLYRDYQRDMDRLREDREVAELEALYDLDWEWPR